MCEDILRNQVSFIEHGLKNDVEGILGCNKFIY